MSPWRRALLGGALGSLLVLLIHPLSRAYYLSALHVGDSRFLLSTQLLPENVRRLPEPKAASEAAYIFLVAAEAEQRAEKLAKKDYTRLYRLAEAWTQSDPDNAFWRQMQSIYLMRLHRESEAIDRWQRAARALKWDNYQNARLHSIVDGLTSESGAPLGWHWAVAYSSRSQAIARQIVRHARVMKDLRPSDEPLGLELRYATLLNGVLLRDGARSNATGLAGHEIVEIASYPERFTIELSQKKLILARQALSNRFRDEGRPDEAARADDGFRDNDAWIALVRPESIPDHVENLTTTALLASGFPGIALMLVGTGALIALLGWGVERSPRLQLAFATPVAPVLGLVLAALTFWATELVFPSLWVVLCFTFFAFAPEHTRRIEPRELGPTFRFVLGILAIAFIGLAALFLLGLSAPGIRLMPILGVPREYSTGSTLVLGLTGIVFGLVLLTAPVWGIVQKFPPPRLAGLALREFGIGVMSISLLLAIVGGPVCVALDRNVRENLSKLTQNEPLYSQNLQQTR